MKYSLRRSAASIFGASCTYVVLFNTSCISVYSEQFISERAVGKQRAHVVFRAQLGRGSAQWESRGEIRRYVRRERYARGEARYTRVRWLRSQSPLSHSTGEGNGVSHVSP